MSIVCCKKIFKSFGNKQVISNLSLDFQTGTTLLTGKNGSGKSTLLMLIAGLEYLNSGTIIFKNKSNNRNCNISISTDSIIAPDVFTLNELFILQRKFNDTDQELLNRLIDALDFRSFLHSKISNVSTGTNKKFSVISALVKNSNLLLLDEPLNGVDKSSQDILKDIIHNDKRDKIIIEHNDLLSFDHMVSL